MNIRHGTIRKQTVFVESILGTMEGNVKVNETVKLRPIIKRKRQPIKWEKVFASDISDSNI